MTWSNESITREEEPSSVRDPEQPLAAPSSGTTEPPTPPPAAGPQAGPWQHEAFPHRYRFRSVFLLATAIFFAGNFCMSFFDPIAFDPYKFPYKGWSWWTFNSLRQQSGVSNIALLGSSTMVSAAAGSDANFLKKPLDLTEHHRSCYLEHKLKESLPGKFRSFSLAAPGQMPSDAYITLRGMVASVTRPDVVIYGLAPRDFVDSTLTAPGDTDAFKFLTRLVNIEDVAHKVFRSPFSKLDWFLQKLIFTYGQSLDIRLALAEPTSAVLDYLLPRPWSSTPFTWWDRQKLLPGYLPAEIHPEAVMAGPIDRKTAESRYTNNTFEYVQRYKNPDKEVFKTQFYFLSKLAEYCRKERIELVLVNMPITLENISLLRPGAYISYLQHLKEFALVHDIPFYDLNDFGRYGRKDFHDSVHLNAFGGQKFFEDVASAIVQDRKVKELVAMSGEHLARRHSLAEEHRRQSKTY